jgi:hypothetical protein
VSGATPTQPARAARRPRGAPMSRARLVASVAALALAGAVTMATHFELWPWPLQQGMRDWALHSGGVLATTLATALMLGVSRHPDGAHRDALLRIALGVPLVVTLLHELGQWLWPDGARDGFDALRDCGLNVVAAVVAVRLLRGQRPAPPGAGADG